MKCDPSPRRSSPTSSSVASPLSSSPTYPSSRSSTSASATVMTRARSLSSPSDGIHAKKQGKIEKSRPQMTQPEQQTSQPQKAVKGKRCQRFYCTGFPPCDLSFTRSEHLARHIRYGIFYRNCNDWLAIHVCETGLPMSSAALECCGGDKRNLWFANPGVPLSTTAPPTTTCACMVILLIQERQLTIHQETYRGKAVSMPLLPTVFSS